jgi:GAF domain-containing protein
MAKRTPALDVEGGDPTAAFAELALITVNERPPAQTLHRVAELAKQVLGGVEDVSLTVIDQGRPLTVVFTGPLAIDLDERQYEVGFGPCLDAAKTGETIILDTGSDDPPYQEFARTAARAGVRHAVSVGLPVAQRSIGGLNIYKTAEGPFDPAFLEHAHGFAGYAAIAVNNITSYAGAVNETTHLRRAMESRAVIEQAKGVIMARNRCTADEAFDMLKRVSQHRNVKLHQIAQSIVASAQNSRD